MELLTVQETAAVLRVAPITVRRYIADGRLPAVKVGKGVRVRKEAVEQLTKPVEVTARKTKQTRIVGRPMTPDDPLSKLVGSVIDVASTDASKKHEYLADAIAPRLP